MFQLGILDIERILLNTELAIEDIEQAENTMLNVEQAGLKEYAAPWLKNETKIVRDNQGKFAGKGGKVEMKNEPIKNMSQPPGFKTNQTFSWNDLTIDVDKAINASQKIKPEPIPVKDLKWIFDHKDPYTAEDLARSGEVDDTPILVAYFKKNKPTVIDGTHRLKKAEMEGKEFINAKVLTQEMIDASTIHRKMGECEGVKLVAPKFIYGAESFTPHISGSRNQ